MKNWKILWVSFLFVFLFSGYCFAASINPGRPFSSFGISSDGASETLQKVLNDITVGPDGSIDAVNDQISAALFNSPGSGGSVATFIIEIAGFASENSFGIYDADDITNTAQIFDGSGTAGDQVLVSYMLNGDIKVGGTVVASGFDNSFGFYITTPESNTFYSEDDKNGDNPQALIYQGDDKTTIQLPGYAPGIFEDNEFIIAFEDLVYNSSDKDFQDLVVLVESIVPVPEPSTMIISSLFLIGAGFYVRRKLHSKS